MSNDQPISNKKPIVMSDLQVLACTCEALLFASDKPLSLDNLKRLLDGENESGEPQANGISKQELRSALDSLAQDYQGRGVELVEVASGFRFQTVQKYSPMVNRLWDEKPQKYSRALLETLALIAYRQPITRGDIEEIRGVSVSSSIIKTLVEREWVRVIGHRDVPGRPSIYATTKVFLDYFNLHSLEQLPALADIRDLDVIGREIAQQLEFGDDKANDFDDAGSGESSIENQIAVSTGNDAPTEAGTQTEKTHRGSAEVSDKAEAVAVSDSSGSTALPH